jgi:hypothetical protein
MVIWLFCLTCVMDSKVSKIAADIAEIKNTSTNSKSTPLCIICGKAHCQHLCPYWPKSGNEV